MRKNDPVVRGCPKTSPLPLIRGALLNFHEVEKKNKPINRPNPQVQGESLPLPQVGCLIFGRRPSKTHAIIVNVGHVFSQPSLTRLRSMKLSSVFANIIHIAQPESLEPRESIVGANCYLQIRRYRRLMDCLVNRFERTIFAPNTRLWDFSRSMSLLMIRFGGGSVSMSISKDTDSLPTFLLRSSLTVSFCHQISTRSIITVRILNECIFVFFIYNINKFL